MDDMTKDTLRQLVEDICYCLHRHEVQTWRDCPGTIHERADIALAHARDAIGLLNGTLRASDCRGELAHNIAMRDLTASGGGINA